MLIVRIQIRRNKMVLAVPYPKRQNKIGGNILNQVVKNTSVYVALCCLCFLRSWLATGLHQICVITEQPAQEGMFKGSMVAAWPLMVLLHTYESSVPQAPGWPADGTNQQRVSAGRNVKSGGSRHLAGSDSWQNDPELFCDKVNTA